LQRSPSTRVREVRGGLSRATIRSFTKLERLLLFFGILLVSIYVANRVYSAIYSHASVQSFWAHQTSSPIVVEAQSIWHSGIPDFHLWSEQRIRAYQTSVAANVSPPLGVLENLRYSAARPGSGRNGRTDAGSCGRPHSWHCAAWRNRKHRNCRAPGRFLSWT
jgi:hypothetical protein